MQTRAEINFCSVFVCKSGFSGVFIKLVYLCIGSTSSTTHINADYHPDKSKFEHCTIALVGIYSNFHKINLGIKKGRRNLRPCFSLLIYYLPVYPQSTGTSSGFQYGCQFDDNDFASQKIFSDDQY